MSIDHFIAYHSVATMGYEYVASERLSFLSKKEAMLNKAIGNTVWVVQGKRNGKTTDYTLCGAYKAELVESDHKSPGTFVIRGRRVVNLTKPVRLNDVEWFPVLFNSQHNFSFGFNRICDEEVIKGLRQFERVMQRP